jgi:hypothetical protein
MAVTADISQGGSVYPWHSSYVLGTLTVGAVGCLAFVFWGLFGWIKDPFVPLHLFRNVAYDCIVTIVASK